MIVLTTTFNCEKYIEKCLNTIKNQTYQNFTCYITDDLSTDSTTIRIKEIIKNDNRFHLIENKVKMYQPGNYDQVIRGMNLSDNEICVEVDGDDWLSSPDVFTKINEIYDNDEIWMTSGSFKYHDGRDGFSMKPKYFHNIRSQTFTLSHLRTWRSWLWKKIKEEDLKDEKNEYWSVAGDLSFMFPMFEMSGEKHYKFIPEVLYIYNESNPINDHKVNMQKVSQTIKIIRNMTPYKKIIS